ncbi:NAD(P)-binding protein [Herbidospora mongoliensis]|uniref:NAD(P)-binding protein n=1 Tax=Herbidospora mongoliensis TaxID=688067 RepID=UPI000A6079DA|nr:NAD(P)-binding protein [Herbidospora mongoliensis]
MAHRHPVTGVGAGLACAVWLRRSGAPVTVLEAADGVGGRMRTDVVDGFRLDREKRYLHLQRCGYFNSSNGDDFMSFIATIPNTPYKSGTDASNGPKALSCGPGQNPPTPTGPAPIPRTAVTNTFAALRLLPRGDRDKDVEILAPRHQIAVLERQLGVGARARFAPEDRAFLTALLAPLPRDVLRRLRLLVRPATVVRWHRIPCNA